MSRILFALVAAGALTGCVQQTIAINTEGDVEPEQAPTADIEAEGTLQTKP